MYYKITQKGYYGQIIPPPQGKLKAILINNLSYKNKWYPGIPEWAKKTKLYRDKTGMFMWGLRFRVMKIMDKWQEISEDKIEWIEVPIIMNENIEFIDKDLREYQKNAIQEFFLWRHGIIQLPTRTGKTRLALEIVNQLKRYTLVVCHTRGLVMQWEDHQNGFCTVVTYQWLVRNLQTVKNYFFIIYDEAHICKAASIKKIAKCSNPKYVLGLTASPHRSDGHDLQIEEVVGLVIYSETTKEMIAKGFLCKPTVYMYDIKYVNNYFEKYQGVYDDNVVNNKERNNIIQKICVEEIDRYKLILVKTKIHGEIIKQLLADKGIESVFFFSKIKNRDKIFKDIKDKKYKCVISTSIFDCGLDLPWLEDLILVVGGRSSVNIIQRTGRPLTMIEGKTVKIFDFKDNCNFLKVHTKIRLQYYKDQGFDIVMVDDSKQKRLE